MTLLRLSGIPLVPDGDEAREWAERELSDPVYREAEPTALDRAARAVADFFAGLFSSDTQGPWGLVLVLIATAVVVVVILGAFLVWGLPRSTKRAPAPTATLFGDADDRTAAQLRVAAAAHAAAGEWDDAIVVRFRALARGLTERGIVDTPPGATVHAFARAAGRAFAAFQAPLEDAATAFDDVRYLRRPGSPDLYARVADVDDAVGSAAPDREGAAAGGGR